MPCCYWITVQSSVNSIGCQCLPIASKSRNWNWIFEFPSGILSCFSSIEDCHLIFKSNSTKCARFGKDPMREALLFITSHYTWIRRCLQQKQIWLIDRKTSAIHLFCSRFLPLLGFNFDTKNLLRQNSFSIDWIFSAIACLFYLVEFRFINSGIRIRLENSRQFMTAKFILAASENSMRMNWMGTFNAGKRLLTEEIVVLKFDGR